MDAKRYERIFLSLGAGLLVIEFFGRDTRVPARLFAEKVLPAFARA